MYRSITSIFLLSTLSCFFSRCIDDSPVGIKSVYPPIGCTRSTLSIIGWGFGDLRSNNQVKVNGLATVIIENTPNLIVVTLPDTETSGRITVQVGNEKVTGPEYTITGPRYYVGFNAD